MPSRPAQPLLNAAVLTAAALVALPPGSLCTPAAFAAVVEREATIHDDLTAQLRKAVTAPGSQLGRQFASLAALRSLRDEKLQALFADLATRPRADLRAEGILGLAELSQDGNVSLAMVGEIKNAGEQSLVLLEALANERLSEAQVTDVLSWPKLDPRLEVALRARAIGKAKEAKPAEAERLAPLSASDNPLVSLLADTLLAHLGDKDGAARVIAAVTKLKENDRGPAIGPVFEMISRERLKGAAAIVTGLTPLCTNDAQRFGALATLMRISPEAATAEWQRQWSKATELAERLRLAMTALEAESDADGTVVNALAGSGIEPCASMGRALLALRAKDPAANADALAALVAQGHAQSTIWALARAADMPAEQARTLLLKIIAFGTKGRETSEAVPKVVYEAAWRLAQIDGAALAPGVAQAVSDKDQPLSEALLAALLRSGKAAAWDSTKTPAFPGRTAQAMATLYEARLAGVKPDITSETRGAVASGGGFDPASDKAERLRQIALGWGGLPEMYRVVAAWLALCQDGKEREALTRLLAPDAP
jgi:hypothetical protein